jgi:hypothetical protein
MAIRGEEPTAFLPCNFETVFSGLGRQHFAAVIMAAPLAEIVREPQFAAIRAFLEIHWLQRMMAAAHVALRGRSFSLRDGHVGTCSVSKIEFMMWRARSQWSTAGSAAGLAAGLPALRARPPIANFPAVASAAAPCNESLH